MSGLKQLTPECYLQIFQDNPEKEYQKQWKGLKDFFKKSYESESSNIKNL